MVKKEGDRNLRIGIDIYASFAGITGIKVYAENLLRYLSKIDFENEYILYSSRGLRAGKRPPLIIKQRNFRNRDIRLPERLYIRLYRSKIPIVDLFCGNVDIFHSLCFSIPNSIRAKLITNIYDISWIVCPEEMSPVTSFFNKWMPVFIKRANKIITCSLSSKKGIVEYYNVPEEKVNVIYGAANENFKRIENSDLMSEVKRKYKINRDYILFVGQMMPRKNIVRLFKAYHQFIEKKLDVDLVLVGPEIKAYPEMLETIKTLSLNEKVIFTGYVPYEDLPLLYNAAKLLVYPALYEGFGLPIVEAMACGTPVVTSNVSSMPEVAGDAAILVNPLSVEEIGKAMYEVLTNTELYERLRDKGLERSKLFSWAKAAEQTLSVYREVYKAKSH